MSLRATEELGPADDEIPAERNDGEGESPPAIAASPSAADRRGSSRRRPVDPMPQAVDPMPEVALLQRARGPLELVGLVAAPTTLLTALGFYFGWALTNSRATYFGIDASALGFSTQDYLLRSADALFVPLGAVCVLTLGMVSLHALATRRLSDPAGRARLRPAAMAAVVSGGVLFALGIVAVFAPLSFSPHYLFPSSSPGVGITLLAYGLHLLGRIRAAAQPAARSGVDGRSRAMAITLVVFLIVLSAFWTASNYADALGRGRAERLAANLTARPQVTVFASKRLDLEANGVVERQVSGDDSAYRYRYSGLRLLIRSGGKYFLLPNGWTRASGAVIVLDDRPDYRFEFGSGR